VISWAHESPIGTETIEHGWARAYPLFVSGGHGGGSTRVGTGKAHQEQRHEVVLRNTKKRQREQQ